MSFNIYKLQFRPLKKGSHRWDSLWTMFCKRLWNRRRGALLLFVSLGDSVNSTPLPPRALSKLKYQIREWPNGGLNITFITNEGCQRICLTVRVNGLPGSQPQIASSPRQAWPSRGKERSPQDKRQRLAGPVQSSQIHQSAESLRVGA